MTKAKKSTATWRDAEDELSDRINKAFALVAICATAARSHECENDQLGLALETARDVLDGVYAPLETIQDALRKLDPAPGETKPTPQRPLDKKTGKAVIAAVKKAMKRPAKKAAANGTPPGEHVDNAP